jgi:hypothetical protein
MSNFSRTRLARTSDVVDVVADVEAAAALTSAALTAADGVGTNNGVIAAITDNATTIAAVQEIVASYTALRADVTEIRTTLNALIDALAVEA